MNYQNLEEAKLHAESVRANWEYWAQNSMPNASIPTINPLDPKGAAGALKPQLHLVPTVAMREEAKALADGRDKYGENNWRTNKVCASTYIGAILRHITAYRDGEDVDPESKSGVNHLGSVRACCAILLDAAENGTLVDDRPVKSTNPDTTIWNTNFTSPDASNVPADT